MRHEISRMVKDYERGRLSRRQLVAHLAAFATAFAGAGVAGRAGGQESGGASSPTFQAKEVDHIALRVTDVERSRRFYEQHLGLTTTDCGPQSCFLSCGGDFLALFRSRTPGLDHYSYGIDNYSASNAVERLEAAGLEAKRRGNRVYFDDPDGIEVQVSPRS